MGFWDIFIRVWQVRTSVRVQNNVENQLNEYKRVKELNGNIPIIIDELNRKNNEWDKEINKLKS